MKNFINLEKETSSRFGSVGKKKKKKKKKNIENFSASMVKVNFCNEKKQYTFCCYASKICWEIIHKRVIRN